MDKSSFLEEGEMEGLLHQLRVDPKKLNWHGFDHDKDGRLSADEFLESGPALADQVGPPPSSLAEDAAEGSEDDEDEDAAGGGSDEDDEGAMLENDEEDEDDE